MRESPQIIDDYHYHAPFSGFWPDVHCYHDTFTVYGILLYSPISVSAQASIWIQTCLNCHWRRDCQNEWSWHFARDLVLDKPSCSMSTYRGSVVHREPCYRICQHRSRNNTTTCVCDIDW